MSASVKIDFLVPGFSKCGTTTLCNLLDRHPGIYIPAIKELWYFSSPNIEMQHQAYDSHFYPAQAHQLKGEGSVSYSGAEYEEIAVERIYENNPNCRFIFIARDPRRRIESSYREMHNSGVQWGLNAPYALGECIRTFPQMLNDSLYWQRISRYRKRFGDKALCVIFLEELQQDPLSSVRRCFDHLGLESEPVSSLPIDKLNTGQGKLYDTQFLRYLRTNPRTGFKLARLSPQFQDKVLRPLGLRRRFGDRAVCWDQEALDILVDQVYPDAEKFLSYCERPLSIWGLDKEN